MSSCGRQKRVTFKINTGAEVTAISKATWQSLGMPDLQLPSKLLYGPAKKLLKTTGHFTSNLSHKDKISQQQIFVVDALKTNLLGTPSNNCPTPSNQKKMLFRQKPLKTKVELNHMEADGVISKVSQPILPGVEDHLLSFRWEGRYALYFLKPQPYTYVKIIDTCL